MRRWIPLAIACLCASAGAQQLSLSTEVTSTGSYARATVRGGSQLQVNLPVGPVAFPAQAVASLFFASAQLRVESRGTPSAPIRAIFETGSGLSVGDSGFCTAELTTVVAMPLPARVRLEVDYVTNTGFSFFSTTRFSAAVDVNRDGSNEFSYSGTGASFPTTAVDVLVDRRGTPILWQSDALLARTQAPNPDSDLQLRFIEPVQDPAYGPTCQGELGSQRDPADPFRRVLVASFPGNTLLAWFLGGDQQANVQFPGFPCPLLNNAPVIVAVPLHAGPNGRKMTALEVTLPPIPGVVWYAQGIAATTTTLIGTNGVRIQT